MKNPNKQELQQIAFNCPSDIDLKDKYEYLTGEEILPSDQSRIISQIRFIYSPLVKTLENQAKLLENSRREQTDAFMIKRKVPVSLINHAVKKFLNKCF